jgi:anaerobic magnesium-protoporphyrin IX monomethyl ester cyclase
MRVLLIQAPLGRNEKAVYPLGLSYIAGSIADKHEFTVLDANLHSRDEIEARLINFKPDLIGIGLRNIDTTQSGDPYFYFQNFPPFIKWIKCLSNNSLIVVGGSGFSMFPYEVMMACPEIDLGVNLEGEKTFPVLLDNLNKPEIVPNVFYRNNNKIIYSGFSELPDFALIGAPPRIIDPTRYQDALYQLGVQTKRGCTHRCLYCNYPALNGHRMRLRHPIDVVDELQVS